MRNFNNSRLSIVVPCHNEEESVLNCYKQLKEIILNITGLKYQIVFVNNGSTDNTLKCLLQIKETDSNIKILDLRNNYGYQGSITAGLFNADYEMIISIDADLQDDPTKIKEMVDLYLQGYDMILGVRKNRKSDNFIKRNFAAYFYRLSTLLGVKTLVNHGDFRLLSSSLVNDLKKFPERNRYLRGMIMDLENNYKCVYYDRVKRTFGKSKFNFNSLVKLALDGITSFSVVPVRLIFFIGLFMFISSIIIFSIFSIMYFSGVIEIKGWFSTIIILLFFGGIQNISIGILGEYISKVYLETKSRPIFLIRKIY